jgi:hypothetical protein
MESTIPAAMKPERNMALNPSGVRTFWDLLTWSHNFSALSLIEKYLDISHTDNPAQVFSYIPPL